VNDEELTGREYTHTLLMYRGFSFDAEAICGVPHWTQLPIFVREGLKKAVGDIV